MGLLAILALLVGAVFGGIYALENIERRGPDGLTRDQRMRQHMAAAQETAVDPEDLEQMSVVETEEAGIQNPSLIEAAQAKIADSEQVIGIVVNGQPRAYLLNGMSAMEAHVVHDTIGDQQVTVTYCDKTNCTRLFHRDVDPDKIQMGGWSGRKMWLMVDGKRYVQDSKQIPLTDFKDYEICSWGEWKKRHPQTKIYLGTKGDLKVEL